MTALGPRPSELPRGPQRRHQWHLAANSGVVVWLVALLLVALNHRFVPESGWLLVHLLLLGAATNAILVWSAHFADALLKRAAPGGRPRQAAELVVLNLGVLATVTGVMTHTWDAVLAGAVLVGAAAAAHGVALVLQLRVALPSRFGATVHYYVAAAAALPVGAGLGAVLARGLGDRAHGRVLLAHLTVNVLGWVGLTVLGTLLTLWPTILRTRIAAGAERLVARALPVLVAGIMVTLAGVLAGVLTVAAAGLAVYLVGAVVSLAPLVTAARQQPPASYAAWSVLAGVAWLVVALVWMVASVATAPDWAHAGAVGHAVAVPLAAGFASQVLLGALSYLVPVVLGRSPARTRAATEALDRAGAARVVVANLGLVVCLLPSPSLVRVAVSGVVLVALGSFLVLLVPAFRAARRDETPSPSMGLEAQAATTPSPARQVPEASALVRGRHTGLAAVGIAAVVLAVAVGAAIDPAGLRGVASSSAAAGVVATGRTTTVDVVAKGMRFHPAVVEAPAGDRLVIRVVNQDRDVHDLTLETGQASGRLPPGARGQVVVPVVGRNLDGWCSVVGHRQMGMVFAVHVTGSTAVAAPAAGAGHDMADMPGMTHSPTGSAPPASGTSPRPDFMAAPPPGFQARDARTQPYAGPTTHRVELTAKEVEHEVAVGVRQRLWTFNGTAPGPVLRGRVGDTFDVTLRNDASMGHSVDFHAGVYAPDEAMRTVAPGESVRFSFKATRAGIWMYHCSTMPMSLHIANGMFGAVIIDPPGLARVAQEYVVVQSELYLGLQGGTADPAKITAEQPDAVVFNGFANQYDHDPLTATTGDRVRIWVLDAGPNRPTSFHLVGGQLDTVFKEGAYLLRQGQPGSVGGAQAIDLQPGQGGFVELTAGPAGHYPFVSHLMVDAERGAHGVLAVSP
ncbi:MAG TPA: multicopper oxidase domain-containing protein [Pedococcus sp.]